jgi:tetratricopeptide (TPR) repeat protein
VVAALRVFVFSAAFPFFSNVDEHEHFDLVMKYASGHVPRGLESYTAESTRFIIVYASPEFAVGPDSYGGTFPPPIWHHVPPTSVAPSNHINYESGEPPLYYALAGLWLRLGEACGVRDGFLLYWIRFLNAFTAAALVWIGFAVGRAVFPDEPILQLGIPILLAVFPQDTFYSIQNDTLSPVFFGLAFLGLLRFLNAEVPRWNTGVLAGLALAASVLVKLSNAPLVAATGVAVLLHARTLAKRGRLGNAFPALLLLGLCAALPVAAWFTRNEVVLGSLTGAGLKIRHLGWTLKPLAEWWLHPLFSWDGLFIFGKVLLSTFWRGEFVWFGEPLAVPSADLFYASSSVLFLTLASLTLLRRPSAGGDALPPPQRLALRFALLSFMAGVAFLATMSLMFDFGPSSRYPSRTFPYLVSGRLLSALLIPFLVLYVRGLDVALGFSRSARLRLAALFCIVGIVTVSEIAVNRPAFASAYNFFHLLSYPYSSEAQYNLGLDMAEQGKLEEAARHYSEAIRIEPAHFRARIALAAILARQGRLEDVIRHYSEAIRINPDSDVAHNGLGLALAGQGKIEEAIGHYSEAIRLKPDYSEAHYNLATALAGQRKPDEAIKHYSEALRIYPDYFEAHSNLAALLAQQGKLQEAIKHYSEALSINPDHERLHFNLGLALAKQGKVAEAIGHFSEAVRIKPDDPLLYYSLGVVYENLGRKKDAIGAFEAALRLKPDFPEARAKLEGIVNR